MIEAKHILSLCDRFSAYLMPLDVHILRQRYNGQTYKSTYAVARDMHISDETVRTVEARALDALSHCLDLEENGQAIIPMRLAKSFRQPAASRICAGHDTFATAATYTVHRGELLIFASSLHAEPDSEDLPLGVIVGRVLLVDCYRAPDPRPHPHKWMLSFEQPEIFPEPMPYSGQPSYFYIPPEISRQLPPRYPFAF